MSGPAGLTIVNNRYYAMRHGQSEANVAGIVCSDPAVGVERYGLTEEGRAQVRASLAQSEGLSAGTRILSSDFARARETAEQVQRLLGAAAVELRVELRERFFGSWEGQANDAYERVWAEDARDDAHGEWGVESAQAVLARTTGLVRDLEASHHGETFLLVSHGDALQILLTGFLGLPAGTHRQREHWAPAEIRRLVQA